MGVGGLIEKLGNWLFLLKNVWGWVFHLEKWVRVGRFCQNKGRNVSLLSKNWWEWVAFLEKWVGVGHFSWKRWESIVFIEKWVGVGRCCRKMSGRWLFLLKTGWEWVRVPGSGWERNSVKPFYWVSGFKRLWR